MMVRRARRALRAAIGVSRVGDLRRMAPLVAAPMGMAVLAIATSAHAAEGPVWKIVSVSSPTVLVANTPRNEVQDLAVSATSGTYTLIATNKLCGGGGEPATTAPIPYDASAAEVQSELEAGALSCEIGAGNVTVTDGPGGGGHYIIELVGERGEQPVPVMTTDSSSLAGGSATVSEAVHGELPPYLLVKAINVGGTATDGSTIAIDDSLPPALTATAVAGVDTYASGVFVDSFGSATMSCATLPTLGCSYSGRVGPGDTLSMRITLKTAAQSLAPEEVNDVAITGGGAAEASSRAPITIGATPASFGPAQGSVVAATSTSQAGAHGNVTAAFTMATSQRNIVASNLRDVRFDFPPGLVGSAVGMPRCTMGKVLTLQLDPNACPSDTMVGMATLSLAFGGSQPAEDTLVTPVYNIAPAPGEPVAFALNAVFLPVRLDTSVLSDGDYGVRVTASGLTEEAEVLSASITIWGIPADHSGPGEGLSIFNIIGGAGSFGGPNPGQTRVPLLTDPQQCSGPLSARLSVDSWEKPGVSPSQEASMGTLTGCDQLSLESSLSVLPDTLEAGAPAGYTVGLRVPQSSSPDGLATPSVQRVKVVLPPGTVVNPSAAWGLGACTDAEFYGSERGEQEPAKPGNCPRDAQVGTVEVKTPSLAVPLTGEAYLAQPECDPCTPQDAEDGKMVRLFLQLVGEGESGVVVKVEGYGMIDQQTGQITTVFEDQPQLPFSELKLTLGGGPRAALSNPRSCGPVSATADLTPWSSPFSADSTPFSEFEVNEDCFGARFAPTFVAGTTSIQAGGYTPFTLSFGRADQDEFLGGLRMSMPPGLLGMLSHVSLCKEPQAAEGTCGPESLIGHVQVLTGPGADPYLVSGGQVFVTEPYGGAPFGLSIVVPAVAGPFTLAGSTGKGTVVVRARIEVDPSDSHLTIVSDPLPQVLDGIPLQLRVVNVTIDRPQFTFNPTSCTKMSFGGELQSSTGTAAGISGPFQVTNCASLAFKPGFSVSTSAHTSRIEGASLHVNLTLPAQAGQGTEANVAKVKVSLPKRLPSPLTTLQKACLEQVFAANPSGCPEASKVGEARVSTPLLAGSLTGPAYFVSHGGAKYPELIMVLTGENGVTVQVRGETFISKQGITTATFATVPDVPFTNFELTLPQRRYPALTANGSLCKGTLLMPTEMVGQNGIAIKQNTKIAVSGCPKARASHKKKAKHKVHGKKKR